MTASAQSAAGRPDIRKVFLITGHPPFEQALRERGCEVRVLHPDAGEIVDAAEALERERAADGFVPDLLVQREQLSGPNALAGLDRVQCPTVFWSLDTHLNQWWQTEYARLFDGVLATQRHLLDGFSSLPGWSGAVGCLPWAGFEREWVPFSKRGTEVGFVGRVTPDRPIRARLAELLRKRWNAVCAEGLDYEGMYNFYADTRLAPNESIFGEVNFRLFETASCGCLALTQDIGHPLDHLFMPGVEMEVYSGAAELRSILDFYVRRPEEAEAVARKGWERVRREHLFIHRARTLLEFARGLPRARAEGQDAAKARLLTMLALWMGGRLPFPPGALERDLLALGDDPDGFRGLCGLYALTAGTDPSCPAKVEALFRRFAGWMESGAGQDRHMGARLGAYLGVSMLALRFGDWPLATRCLPDQAGRRSAPPTSPTELLKAWARILRSEGRILRPGFRFDPARHLPETAGECLLAALDMDREDLEACRMLDFCLAGVRGAEHPRVGVLSSLSLREPDNWRLAATLGLLDISVFRLDEGLEELRAARALAESKGKGKSFERMLAAADPRGAVRESLAG